MDMIAAIGNSSLNLSLMIYLVAYFPQLVHNQRTENLAQLSVSLHFLLAFGSFCDLVYGFAAHLPWQYKTVSIVILLLVIVQHWQLLHFFIQHNKRLLSSLSIVFLFLNLLGTYYFFVIAKQTLVPYITLLIGALAQACALLYCVPQLIKNKYLQQAQALSVYFIYLTLLLACLDTVSAWCLNWGWPNKVSAPLLIIIMSTHLAQTKKYRSCLPPHINHKNFD